MCHTIISDKPVIVSIVSKFIIDNIPTNTQVHNNSSSLSLFLSYRPIIKPKVYVYLLLYFSTLRDALLANITKGHAYVHSVTCDTEFTLNQQTPRIVWMREDGRALAEQVMF